MNLSLGARITLLGLLVGAALLVVFVLLTKDAAVPIEQPPVVEVATTTEAKVVESPRSVIGTSVEGREIEAYSFGGGETTLLFVGGIHGGYEWNSVLLAYAYIDHLSKDPSVIPEGMTIRVIPSLNPDGVFEVIGKEGRFTLTDVPANTGAAGTGRFNARGVDLNRNFDCKWKPESTWRGTTVSAGTKPFSEPEAEALRSYVEASSPDVVVFWHSQANAVYASECTEGILPGTRTAMNAYATAAGYTAVDTFDAYPVTGDAEGWLASIGIPAITVELATHEAIEWEKNLRGVRALVAAYTDTNLAR